MIAALCISSVPVYAYNIWEAQFGDFANGAQVIIDQLIASCEYKWGRRSGLVLLLPHGYEGQGPEHSSARLERFLELCGENNLQVCNFTTPAQLFHALRQQVKRSFRKPLIVMTPKSLLRHPLAVSPLADFVEGAFRPLLPDPEPVDPSLLDWSSFEHGTLDGDGDGVDDSRFVVEYAGCDVKLGNTIDDCSASCFDTQSCGYVFLITTQSSTSRGAKRNVQQVFALTDGPGGS